MNTAESLKSLTKFEKCLWLISVSVITGSFFISGSDDILSLIASLIGVTSLIFLARGFALGNVIMIIFSILYGIISFGFSYYGEMITYLGMTLPMAVVSLISWLRHPYKKTAEVEVSRLTRGKIIFTAVSSIFVTVAFYFILRVCDTANLLPSTMSVLTSFVAATLTAFRCPYFALAYAANDLILVLLWALASIEDISYLSMVICFVMFFINDFYGFICWKRMEKRQQNK